MNAGTQYLIVTCSTPIARRDSRGTLDRLATAFPRRETAEKLDNPRVDAHYWKPAGLDDTFDGIVQACEENKHYPEDFPVGVLDEIHVLTLDDPRYPYLLVVLDCALTVRGIREQASSTGVSVGEVTHWVRLGLQVFLDRLAGREPDTEGVTVSRCPSITYAASKVSSDNMQDIRSLIEERDEGDEEPPDPSATTPEEDGGLDAYLPINLTFQGRGVRRSVIEGRSDNILALLGDGAGAHHPDVRNPTIHVIYFGSWKPEIYPFMTHPQPHPVQLANGNFRWLSLMLAAGSWMEPAGELISDLEKRVAAGIAKVSGSRLQYANPFWLIDMVGTVIELSSMISYVSYLRRTFNQTLVTWADDDGRAGAEEKPIPPPRPRFFESTSREAGYLERFAESFREDLGSLNDELEDMHRGARLTIDYVSTVLSLAFTGALVLLTIALILINI